MGLDGITQAGAAVMQQARSKAQVFNQITQEANQNRQQNMLNLVQKQTEAEKIAMQGLQSKGGRLDIRA